jgi:hypothetical protein
VYNGWVVRLQKAVEKQDEEGKRMWVSAMPESQRLLKKYGLEQMDGPVCYLHDFGFWKPQNGIKKDDWRG